MRGARISPYKNFPTGGGTIAIAVGDDRQFVALDKVLCLHGRGKDPRFSTNERRVENRTDLSTVLKGGIGH
ncbi:CoA transferase [Pseudarthrobacter sp. NPDC055928]|uniref:CoA transferase n=1 Tax=Pseudarthrobacter sp. NPDC055928 TaxID=3345661 RepID=UPI0035DAE8D0